jgi:hypothetical protein
MRYEQQVVLQMPPGSAGQAAASSSAGVAPAVDGSVLKTVAPVAEESTETTVPKSSVKTGDKLALKPAAKAPIVAAKRDAATKTVAKPAHVTAQSEVAHAVPAKKSAPKTKPHAAAPKHHPVVTKHPAGTTEHHLTQVAHP